MTEQPQQIIHPNHPDENGRTWVDRKIEEFNSMVEDKSIQSFFLHTIDEQNKLLTEYYGGTPNDS